MNALTKARFERGMYAVGAVVSGGMASVSTIYLFAGIGSISSNVLYLLFGIALCVFHTAVCREAHSKVRRLASQVQQKDGPQPRSEAAR